MLKLLKWELRQTGRILLPLMGAYLAVAGAAAALVALNRHWFTVERDAAAASVSLTLSAAASPVLAAAAMVLFTALVLGAVALMAATVIVNIQRFYRMLGDEGYLAFSLPVTAAAHIGAKLLCALLYTALAAAAAAAGTGSVLLTAAGAIRLEGFGPGVAAQLALAVAMGCACGYLAAYLACAIGMGWRRHRLAGSVLAWAGLNVLAQGLLAALGAILAATGAWRGLGPALARFSANDPYQMTAALALAAGLGALAAGAVCFALTRFLLARRLNLP